ncbi:hypothetical protein [Halalkalibacter alkalisediminis]|uniref:Uncharacterized protein n=1 Tax=Halalkalibacter alkalisediminis TaxID=935616 RepID=A0ABV6NCM8_9BACI|nr:hypothetical protein [Halalkalibacter alkalisediminis]
MEYYEPELKDLLITFEKLLAKYPDTPDSVYVFKNFLKQMIRIKPKRMPVPSGEIMSIINHKKPIVFSMLRMQASDNPFLYFLTDINMKFDQAETSIKQFKAKLK